MIVCLCHTCLQFSEFGVVPEEEEKVHLRSSGTDINRMRSPQVQLVPTNCKPSKMFQSRYQFLGSSLLLLNSILGASATIGSLKVLTYNVAGLPCKSPPRPYP